MLKKRTITSIPVISLKPRGHQFKIGDALQQLLQVNKDGELNTVNG